MLFLQHPSLCSVHDTTLSPNFHLVLKELRWIVIVFIFITIVVKSHLNHGFGNISQCPTYHHIWSANTLPSSPTYPKKPVMPLQYSHWPLHYWCIPLFLSNLRDETNRNTILAARKSAYAHALTLVDSNKMRGESIKQPLHKDAIFIG